MSIYAVTGKPRHGKTFFVVSKIPRWLKNGERIFSNIKLNFGKGALKKFSEDLVGDIYKPEDLENPEKKVFYWRNIHEWNLMNNGIIIVDEAQKYFNARAWSQLSEDTEAKLQEHGKEDLDVWAITQHYSRIDITLRILVEIYFKVTMVMGNPDNEKGPVFGLLPKRSIAEAWMLEDLEKVERLGRRASEDFNDIEPEWSENIWIRKKYFSIYDTRAKVGRSLPMPLVHKERNCPVCGSTKIEHA